MKTNVLDKLRTLSDIVREKSLEWIEYLVHIFTTQENGCRHLCEEYSMKRESMEEDYIKEFLKERERIIASNGYRMQLDSSYVSSKSEEIGIVVLRSKGRYIDHATLMAGPPTDKGNRIIYWNFDKKKE